RIHSGDGSGATAVLKWVDPYAPVQHPHGWHGDAGHARKLASYRVETAFYQSTGATPNTHWRVPACIASGCADDGQVRLLLEDLDAAGFAQRAHAGDHDALDACVTWLAAFHASHLNRAADTIWPVGCYWHLGTRADEWHAMPAGALKSHAAAIDTALNSARFQTWVHGDAKLANFCLNHNRTQAAAVDFQYVGAGVGVRDLMVLCASALDDSALTRHADSVLERYFERLRARLHAGVAGAALEAEWRALWPFAWADYLRFLAGWSPGHTRNTAYAEAQTARALAQLA
ncbi:MAG: phosphotransferase, partial [Pseudomonadota bacterium]